LDLSTLDGCEEQCQLSGVGDVRARDPEAREGERDLVGALGPSPLSRTANRTSLPTKSGLLANVYTPLITATLPRTFRQSISAWPRKPEERFSIWASPLALPSAAWGAQTRSSCSGFVFVEHTAEEVAPPDLQWINGRCGRRIGSAAAIGSS